jgi:prepilin-type N-terminal cleavage/methylation domain-containing protein
MGGFTLLEMLLVLALIGILVCLASWGGQHLLQGWQVYRAGHQLLEDLKEVQGKAEISASLAMSGGFLVQQARFLVFDQQAGRYAALLWQDLDNDGYTRAGEIELLWQKALPPGVVFGWSPGITRRACSNTAGEPGAAITFASPGYQPCNNSPCIKFDHNGFSLLGPGAIYVRAGPRSMAITGTRPGHFTLCAWGGAQWR